MEGGTSLAQIAETPMVEPELVVGVSLGRRIGEAAKGGTGFPRGFERRLRLFGQAVENGAGVEVSGGVFVVSRLAPGRLGAVVMLDGASPGVGRAFGVELRRLGLGPCGFEMHVRAHGLEPQDVAPRRRARLAAAEDEFVPFEEDRFGEAAVEGPIRHLSANLDLHVHAVLLDDDAKGPIDAGRDAEGVLLAGCQLALEDLAGEEERRGTVPGRRGCDEKAGESERDGRSRK